MPTDDEPHGELVLETTRLRLRPWRVSEAAIQRELWAERDARVPERRRIDALGRPTVADIAEGIRAAGPPSTIGLLAVERKDAGDLIGYAGLAEGGSETEGEPELAYELLRRTWGQGYATEAARAVLERARSGAHERVWATVWDWNTGSLRVLEKLGFTEVRRVQSDEVGATNVVTMKPL